MNLFIYMLTIWSFGLTLSSHDVAVATFAVSENEGSLSLLISIDAEDFYGDSNSSKENVNLKKLQSYFAEHLAFLINNKTILFELTEYVKVKDHLHLKATFSSFPQRIKTMVVKNTCLIEVSNHSNIVRINLNDQNKDFRMHKGRTEINLKY